MRLSDAYVALRPEDVPPAGLAEARAAVARFAGVRPENVILTCGATAALTAVLTIARIRKAARVLLPRPHFPGYPGAAALCGLRVGYYAIDSVQDLPQRKGLRHALIVINSPHNPTGSVVISDALARIVERVRDADGIVVVDESFAGIGLDGNGDLPSGIEPSLVRVGGFNKRFPRLSDHRVGYAVASEAVAKEIAIAHRTLSLGTSVSSQRAVIDLLVRNDAEELLHRLSAEISEHADLAMESLLASPYLRPVRPLAGFFMIVHLKNPDADCVAFAAALRERTGLWCASAPSFGIKGPWIRLRLGVPRDQLRRHCRDLVNVANDWFADD